MQDTLVAVMFELYLISSVLTVGLVDVVISMFPNIPFGLREGINMEFTSHISPMFVVEQVYATSCPGQTIPFVLFAVNERESTTIRI